MAGVAHLATVADARCCGTEWEARDMATVHDHYREGIVFVSCVAVDRAPVLAGPATFHLLRTVLHRVQQALPFHMAGYVFLRDHLHLLLRPSQAVRVGWIVEAMVAQFGQDYSRLMGMPAALAVWEDRYVERRIRDVDDFATHLDYLHYDPVHHGLVRFPEEWPESSYQGWVERGIYKLGWGWSLPESLQGRDWG
jgi:putative transposase